MKKQTIYGMLAAVMLVVLVSVGLVSGGANAQGDPTPSPELEEALERAANFSGGNADWTPVIQDFDGVEMVLVPAGCFEMGSTDEQIEAAFQLCEREYGQDSVIGVGLSLNARYTMSASRSRSGLGARK